MDVLINRHALSDAPYQDGNEGVCTFTESQTENFVSELIYGNQTCYLVSGYRGVGKTSFINRVRQLVEGKSHRLLYNENKRILPLDKKKPETYHPIFVYTSFAKYNSQTAFLRQMIRSLFLAFEEKKVNGKPVLSLLNDDVQKEFRRLNQRTFFDVKTQYEISNESTTEQTTELNTRLSNLTVGIIKAVIPAPMLVLAQNLIKHYEWPNWIWVISWIAGIAYFLWGLVQIKRIQSEKSSERESVNADELYDDEISSYYFEKTLKNLKGEGFKVVFILDELDKVNDKEISTLINEMKPHLLSGLADFIVVAGQQLTYKYVSAFSEDDDEVVGSLFSKVFHVPLKRTSELHGIVKEKILNTVDLSELQLTQLDEFIGREVFYSTRIPRILINRIRQVVTWNEDRAYLTIPDSGQNKKYQELIDAIDGIIKDTIDPRGYKEVVRDYLIVQLYRTAIRLDGYDGRAVVETDILGKFQKSAFFHHPLYFDKLAPCLTKLLVRLQPVLNLNVSKEGTNKIFGDSVAENTNPDTVQSAEISNSALSRSLDVFKQEMEECTWVLRVTYLALGGDSTTDVNKLTAYDFLNRFINNGFLQIDIPKNPLFKQFLNASQILDNRENLYEAYKITQDERIDFNTIAYNVLEGYLRQALNTIFEDYTLSQFPSQTEPDFLLLNESSDLSDLLLDFKFLKSGVSNLKASEIAHKLFDYNRKSSKGNYFALVVFTSEAQDSYDVDVFRLRSELRNLKFSENLNVVLNEEFSIIIISIQFLNRIYDALTLIKNKMFSYKIDESGLPVQNDFAVMSSRKFTFQNQRELSTDPTRNDHTLLHISKVPPKVAIEIVPLDCQYWRCGLKFSSDGVFPKFEDGRHLDGYPEVHVSVGEPKKAVDGKPLIKDGKYVWSNPERLKISNYSITPEQLDWAFDEYNGGIVTLEFSFDQGNRAVLRVLESGRYVGMFTYTDDRLKFFKISAWADHLNFKLNTKILIDDHRKATTLKGDLIKMASPEKPLNSSIGSNILASPDGIFSIWGFVTDVHNKIFGEELNMYLAGYASNQGKDLKNPSLARYPNAWGISRIVPTHKNPLGLWRFHCNNIKKDFTQLRFEDALPNGWHLFSIAWSIKGDYIKFVINDKIVDESLFRNWPADFSHSIRLGVWASGSPEFYFNSKVGPWQFVPHPYEETIINEQLNHRPE
jgi:Cdc6-like AAA superfamily ATPase